MYAIYLSLDVPIGCSITLEENIATGTLEMLTKANRLKVISIVMVMSNILAVVIVNKYDDWKGTCMTNGGIVPLIRKSPSALDSPTNSSIIMISKLKYSTVTFGFMINNASNTTVPIGE